jgi:hypothetical protein
VRSSQADDRVLNVNRRTFEPVVQVLGRVTNPLAVTLEQLSDAGYLLSLLVDVPVARANANARYHVVLA